MSVKIALAMMCLLFSVAALADERADGVLKQYQDYLSTLSQDDPACINKAAGQFLVLFSGEERWLRDRACIDFLAFYRNVSLSIKWAIMKKEHVDTAEEEKFLDDDANVREFARLGVVVVPADELGWESIEHPEFALRFFGPHVSASIRRYLEDRSLELGRSLFGDGTLMISLDEVGDRIVRWEKYLDDYPNSLMKADAQALYGLYLRILLFGDCHSGPFDGRDYEVAYEPFILAFKQFLGKHPDTEAAKHVASYLQVIERNGMKFTPEVREVREGLRELVESFSPPDDNQGFYCESNKFISTPSK